MAALLMFGPLAFGAVEEWSTLVLEAGAAVLLMVWAVGFLSQPERPVRWCPAFAIVIAAAVVVSAQLLLGLSAYAYAGIQEALKYVAYAILFFIAVQCLQTEDTMRRFAVALTGFGFLVAVFAAIQGFTSPGKLYWIREPRFSGWVYGPYVNHNHYAGLMEMLAAVPLAMSLKQEMSGGKRLLLIFAGLTMAATIFLSGSRGGSFAFVVEMALLAAAVTVTRSARAALALTLVVALILAAGLLGFGGVPAVDRLGTIPGVHGAASDIRYTILQDGLRMARQRPWLGWGAGTFPVVYPQFRSFFTNDFVNQAHNDYLQLLVETGAAGFLLLLAFLFLLFRRAVRHLRYMRINHASAASVGAAVGCAGILVHSVSDFNMHIPANAALFFVLAAVAMRGRRRASPIRSDIVR